MLPDVPKGPAGLDIAVDLMHSLMKAHSSRHGGSAARIPEAVEAETVVRLAVAIVQMLSMGVFRSGESSRCGTEVARGALAEAE